MLPLLNRLENILQRFITEERDALCVGHFKWRKGKKIFSLTEDCIKGLLIQFILRQDDLKDLYAYQDVRVRPYEKNNPDQTADFVLTTKKLSYNSFLSILWEKHQQDMLICEIKLSSETRTERIKDDQGRIEKWENAPACFIYLQLGTKNQTPEIYLWKKGDEKGRRKGKKICLMKKQITY